VNNTSALAENLYQEDLYQISTGTMIVLSKEWTELRDEDKALLTKILGSVKLNLAVVRIVVRKEFSPEDLAAYSPARIIAFGSVCKSAPAMYQHQSLAGISIISADALDILDDLKKKNLWLALKQMFGI
jgi:hypothetical protein